MSTLTNTVIALALVFFLLSLLASALQESLASLFNSRGKLLEQAIEQLLTGVLVQPHGLVNRLKDSARTVSRQHLAPDTLAAAVLNHGLLGGLSKGQRLPSYIPADEFADALIDVLRRLSGAGLPTVEGLLLSAVQLPAGKPREALETMLLASGQDIVRFRSQLIDWYDATMDRVTGWYTRAVRYRTFLLGLGLAACLQVNAISITTDVWSSDAVRGALVAAALQSAHNGIASDSFANTQSRLEDLSLPIGWSWCTVKRQSPIDGTCPPGWHASGWDGYKIFLMFCGWLLTAVAVSQGAPFWFKLLNQLVPIRDSGGKPKDRSKSSGHSPGGCAGASPWAPPPGVSLSTAAVTDRSTGDVRESNIPHSASP
jgi:hypothetical protein